MKCEKVRKNLSAYADGELDEKLQRWIGDHLSVCEKCAAELSRLEKVAGMTKLSLRQVVSGKEPPRDLQARIVRSVELVPQPRTVVLSVRRLVAGATFVALLVGFLVGLVLESRFRSEREALQVRIARQGRALGVARNSASSARRQLMAAETRVETLQRELRLAERAASQGDQIAAETPRDSRYAWRPVLSSLQMPGAQSLLQNGLF